MVYLFGMDLQRATQLWTTYEQEPRRNAYAGYAALRERGPVHRVPLADGTPAWAVVGYHEARQALAHPLLAHDTRRLPPGQRPVDPLAAAGLERHLLTLDPPDHTRLRRLVGGAFTAKRVAALEPRIAGLVGELLDELAGKGGGDLLEAFAVPLSVTVICEIMGIPAAERDTFRSWVRDLTAPAGRPEVVRRAGGQLAGYLTALIAGKRAAFGTDLGTDLVSALVDARDGADRLTDGELLAMLFLLLVAGHETTLNLIGNGALALLRHPDQLALLRAEPELLGDAVEELIRYEAPVDHATFRWAVEDVELAGTRIPAGAGVLVILGAAGRDPAANPAPDELDLRRTGRAHLGFGHGVHHCLGAPLARLEARLAIGGLVSRLPGLRLAVGEDELELRPSLLIRGYREIPVAVG